MRAAPPAAAVPADCAPAATRGGPAVRRRRRSAPALIRRSTEPPPHPTPFPGEEHARQQVGSFHPHPWHAPPPHFPLPVLSTTPTGSVSAHPSQRLVPSAAAAAAGRRGPGRGVEEGQVLVRVERPQERVCGRSTSHLTSRLTSHLTSRLTGRLTSRLTSHVERAVCEVGDGGGRREG